MDPRFRRFQKQRVDQLADSDDDKGFGGAQRP